MGISDSLIARIEYQKNTNVAQLVDYQRFSIQLIISCVYGKSNYNFQGFASMSTLDYTPITRNITQLIKRPMHWTL